MSSDTNQDKKVNIFAVLQAWCVPCPTLKNNESLTCVVRFFGTTWTAWLWKTKSTVGRQSATWEWRSEEIPPEKLPSALTWGRQKCSQRFVIFISRDVKKHLREGDVWTFGWVYFRLNIQDACNICHVQYLSTYQPTRRDWLRKGGLIFLPFKISCTNVVSANMGYQSWYSCYTHEV